MVYTRENKGRQKGTRREFVGDHKKSGNFHRKDFARKNINSINRLSARVKQEFKTPQKQYIKWLLGLRCSHFRMCLAVHGKMEANANLSSEEEKMIERTKSLFFFYFAYV